MAAYYVDSSASAKNYLREPGSAWVRSLYAARTLHQLYTVVLAGPELVAAVARRLRGGLLSAADAQRALAALHFDLGNRLIPIEAGLPVITHAIQLAEHHALRGYDAVHLAVALTLQRRRAVLGLPPLVFISADLEQLRAARAEGLAVDDPNAHP